MSSRLAAVPVHTEKSTDPRFCGRLRRLILVSAVVLGLITLLAGVTTDAPPVAVGMLAAGWVLMPTLLYAGLDRPRLRYLLAVPATLVAAGLISVLAHLEGGPVAQMGWWLITAGALYGGGLGIWFWYRWMPVPEALDDPFSPGRIVLISIHVALIVVGVAMVIGG